MPLPGSTPALIHTSIQCHASFSSAKMLDNQAVIGEVEMVWHSFPGERQKTTACVDAWHRDGLSMPPLTS
eukprot:363391-Chlamydomonas_euryale.AAC.7